MLLVKASPLKLSALVLNHCFLLASNDDLCVDNGSLRGYNILGSDALLIDPSFKIIKPFMISDYDINSICSPERIIQHDHDLKLCNNRRVPLGINELGEFISLVV